VGLPIRDCGDDFGLSLCGGGRDGSGGLISAPARTDLQVLIEIDELLKI
jgi:hypothetical protein